MINEILYIELVEGLLSHKHGVEDTTRGPDIHALIVGHFLEHLRGPKGDGAGVGVHFVVVLFEFLIIVVVLVELGHVEVRDLYHLPLGADQDVVGLKVPVHDAFGVEVLDALEDLLEKQFGNFFGVLPHLGDHFEHFLALEELHDQVDVACVIVDEQFVDLDDVGVGELFEVGEFFL